MPEPLSEAEEVAAIVRAGLWALFAAASLARSGARDLRVDTAAIEADQLLDEFSKRFPIEELLA